MNNKPAVKITRIENLDQPLYRIFPLWFFEEALRTKNLAFVPPRRWPDPYEDVCSNVIMSDQRHPGSPQKELQGYLSPALAQCWSFENNSDILLRAYSNVTLDPHSKRNTEPGREGVRVQTTPRRLIHAFNQAAPKLPNYRFYLGKVIYGQSNQITQHVTNTIHSSGAAKAGEGDSRADLLFLKRDYFRHEEEVRALAIGTPGLAASDILYVPFDPNYVIQEVEFDPRLITFESREREEQARKLGYTGQFSERSEAIGIFFHVVLPDGWGDD